MPRPPVSAAAVLLLLALLALSSSSSSSDCCCCRSPLLPRLREGGGAAPAERTGTAAALPPAGVHVAQGHNSHCVSGNRFFFAVGGHVVVRGVRDAVGRYRRTGRYRCP